MTPVAFGIILVLVVLLDMREKGRSSPSGESSSATNDAETVVSKRSAGDDPSGYKDDREE